MDNDDAEMEDGEVPTPEEVERSGRAAREAQKRHEKMQRLLDDSKRCKIEQSGEVGSGSGSFVGKRSPRRSKESAFSMSSANTTSWGSCRMFVFSGQSDVLFVQEAKVTAELLEVQNALQRNGWRGAFSAPISKSRLGASGGVAVLAKSRLGLCSMRYGENFAWNHEVEPGRVVEAFLPAAGGIVLYSVYLHDGEGLDERNRGILHLIGERIRAHQLPVIVAGDFNFPVSVLQESGWMRRLQLHVLQPDTHVPTFVTRNGVSYNDFVLVSQYSAGKVQGYVCEAGLWLTWAQACVFQCCASRSNAEVQGAGQRCDDSVCQKALLQSAACRLCPRLYRAADGSTTCFWCEPRRSLDVCV